MEWSALYLKQILSVTYLFAMLLKRLLLILVFFTAVHAFAQSSIAGIWEGKFLTNEGNLGLPKLVVEIYDVKDSTFSGITHLYYEGNKYEHYKMIGWYSKKDSLLVFREASTIAVDLGEYGNCLGTYVTSMKRTDNNLFQNGYWTPNRILCTTNSLIWLQKKNPEPVKTPEKKTVPVPVTPPAAAVPANEKALQKQTAPAVITAPSTPEVNRPAIRTNPLVLPEKIKQRETDVQSLIEIAPADKDSIKVEIYDNGDIDGDSVSLYQDASLLINKKLITATALTFYVSLNKNNNPISHLRLVAESLGTIPPCTALMIVTTKSKRYEVRLSSNFKKNATVELFLKE
jgi:hypothetical protein